MTFEGKSVFFFLEVPKKRLVLTGKLGKIDVLKSQAAEEKVEISGAAQLERKEYLMRLFFYSFVSVNIETLILSVEVYSQNQFKQKILHHQKEVCFNNELC